MQNSDNFSVSGQNKSWFVTDSSSMCAVQYPTSHPSRAEREVVKRLAGT